MHEELKRLVDLAWEEFGRRHEPHIVRPAVPILFFGDLAAYERSDIRIITVGLNPSSAEFPADAPPSRFPAARTLASSGIAAPSDAEAYIEALSSYFCERPYRRWFDGAFGGVLEGAGASFYRGKRVALHTDICSPLATDPTWSGLTKVERAVLIETGLPLWHALIEYLQPDLVLISVARKYLAGIQFAAKTPWMVACRVERNTSYEIFTSDRILGSGKSCIFAFGQAAQLPFGTVSKEDKKRIGRLLVEAVNA